MLEPTDWPDWVQIARLLMVFALAAGLGIHAYGAHVREFGQMVSSRRWMYWLYSVAFLVMSVTNFVQLAISLAFRSYTKASFHLGYFTLLVVVSYVALIVGVRRKP